MVFSVVTASDTVVTASDDGFGEVRVTHLDRWSLPLTTAFSVCIGLLPPLFFFSYSLLSMKTRSLLLLMMIKDKVVTASENVFLRLYAVCFLHPGGNPGVNLKSISHRRYPILVAFV